MRLIQYMTAAQDNNIILDFFSGSATTAHAVMQLNTEDSGNRRFILVQLPEVCAPDSEATKAAMPTSAKSARSASAAPGKS